MWKVLVRRSALLALGVGAASFAVGSAYAAYLGSGKWSSGSLSYCHSGSYFTPCTNAGSTWSSATDLSLSYSCTAPNLYTVGSNYGNNGWYGLAYICAGSVCNNQSAWNGTYTYAEARNNTYYLGSWTNTERQFNCSHELGHVWSLGHDSRSTSLMKTGRWSTTSPDSGNRTDVNAKY